MTPRWEPPTKVQIICPHCGTVIEVKLSNGGMTDQQVNFIMEELRMLHPEVYEEEPPLNPS